MSHPVRTILVFESRPRWEPELQRQFVDELVRVRGCRAWSELSTQPADIVVIELSSHVAGCLQWLTSRIGQPRVLPVIVLCPPETPDLEWPLRDAGACEVVVGETTGECLARTCRRLWSAS